MAAIYDIQSVVSDENGKTLTLKILAEDQTLAEPLKHQIKKGEPRATVGYSQPHHYENSLLFKVVVPLDLDPIEVFYRAFDGLLQTLSDCRKQIEDKMIDDDRLESSE